MGICWSVGNGRSILVASATWIPGNKNHIVSEPIMNEELRVSELIDQTTRTWRREIICSTFSNADAESITQIPQARVEHDDLLVRCGKATRDFSV